MKTLKYFFAFLLCLSFSQVQAQLNIGIKGGVTKAWQNYGPDVPLPDDAETDVTRMNLSVTAYYKLSKHVSLGIEPGFVQRGAACEPGFFAPFVGDTKLLLDYVQLPIMASGHLPIWNNKLEIIAKLGYGTGFIVRSQREVMQTNGDGDLLPGSGRQRIQDTSFLNRVDHGAYGGLGLAINLGKHQISLETDGYMGFRDADKFNFSKNRSLSYTVGLSRQIF